MDDIPNIMRASSVSWSPLSSEFSAMNAFNPTRGKTLSSAAAISLSTFLSDTLEFGENSVKNLVVY